MTVMVGPGAYERVYQGCTVQVAYRHGGWRWRINEPGDDFTWSSRRYDCVDTAFEAARLCIEDNDEEENQ